MKFHPGIIEDRLDPLRKEILAYAARYTTPHHMADTPDRTFMHVALEEEAPGEAVALFNTLKERVKTTKTPLANIMAAALVQNQQIICEDLAACTG